MKFLTKCPFCIGHINNDRKTLYLYALTDSYWCARCKRSGKIEELPDRTDIQVASTVSHKPKEGYNNSPGERFSVCKQRNSLSDRDEFEIKKSDGIVTGKFTRRFNPKFNMTEGHRFFCYRDDFLVPGELYRVVEGVYDCVYPNDIALLGYPSHTQARDLKRQRLILCPDGDVWTNKKTVSQWILPFVDSVIEYIEVLPLDKDPDQVPLADRRIVEFEKVVEWVRSKG